MEPLLRAGVEETVSENNHLSNIVTQGLRAQKSCQFLDFHCQTGQTFDDHNGNVDFCNILNMGLVWLSIDSTHDHDHDISQVKEKYHVNNTATRLYWDHLQQGVKSKL